MIFKVEKTLITYVEFDVTDEDIELIKKDFSEQKEVEEKLDISTKAFK